MTLIWGSSFMPLFNFLWTTMIIMYPSIAFYSLFYPDFQQELLLESFWIIYIFGTLQVAMVMFNHDIILGEAARKLRVQTSTLVDNVTWMNTTVSTLNIFVFSGFCIFAEQDYLKQEEGKNEQPQEP